MSTVAIEENESTQILEGEEAEAYLKEHEGLEPSQVLEGDEALAYLEENGFAHYGIPGMRWGKRKAGDDGGDSGPRKSKGGDSDGGDDGPKKVGRTERIKTARNELQSKLDKADRADRAFSKAVGTKGEKRAKTMFDKASQDYVDTFVQANKLTRGEQAAIVGGVVAVMGAHIAISLAADAKRGR